MERTIRRSHAMGLRSVALVLVGLGVAAACSDDSSTPDSNNPTPNGGEGGEPVSDGGKGGSSSAGKPSTGGTQASMGGASAGESGEAGMAGTPHMATLGEQCTTCGATECTDKLKSCTDGTECGAWLTCITACDTSECVSACDAKHEAAARVYSDVYDCLCTSCKDDCTGVDACGKKTCTDENPLPISDAIPATLAETGLYALVDGAGGAGGAGGAASAELAMPIAIAPGVNTFEPKYPLWADGAVKQRYVYIPKCEAIDTIDMDHWKFPVGTRLWKQFTIADKVIETRLMHHFGPGEADWVFAAYQWDQNDPGNPAKAVHVPAGVVAAGTGHDIPPVGACTNCHGKLSERVLGFGAFQLSHAAAGKDVAIKEISELGWLTKPAPDGFSVPGTQVQQAALGYLHGNCGGCHNQSQSIPNAENPLYLRLIVKQTNYATLDAVSTTVGDIVSNMAFAEIKGKPRIDPMSPSTSAILIRMEARGSGLQMPPIFTNSTKVADTDGGVKAVTDWVNSIPKL